MKVIVKIKFKVTIRFLVESFFRYDFNLYETNHTWENIWSFRYLFAPELHRQGIVFTLKNELWLVQKNTCLIFFNVLLVCKVSFNSVNNTWMRLLVSGIRKRH